MAHQTSAIVRKQSTPHRIGRVMDGDVSGCILPRCIQIRWTGYSRQNGIWVTAVKGPQLKVSY
jgi:hypothetical protein